MPESYPQRFFLKWSVGMDWISGSLKVLQFILTNGTRASGEGWIPLMEFQEMGHREAHCSPSFSLETSGKEPTWNFWKYLVAPDGKVVGAWDPTVSVEEIRPQVTALVRKLILKKREDL